MQFNIKLNLRIRAEAHLLHVIVFTGTVERSKIQTVNFDLRLEVLVLSVEGKLD